MTTMTEHKAIKTHARKDHWGLTRATWNYRGVNLDYAHRTTRRAPWHVVVYGQQDWWRMLGRTIQECTKDVIAFNFPLEKTESAPAPRTPLIIPWEP